MTDGNKSAMVTRTEFYRALSVIWVYISLLLADQWRSDGRWTTMMLFLLSICMICAYSWTSYNAARQARANGN